MKKCSEETQTLCTGYSKAEPKISARRKPTSRGHGTAKI